MISRRTADYDNYLEKEEIKKSFEEKFNHYLLRGNVLAIVITMRMMIEGAKYNHDNAVHRVFKEFDPDPSLFSDKYQDIISRFPPDVKSPLKETKDAAVEILNRYRSGEDYTGVRVQVINEEDYPSDHVGEIKDYRMSPEGREFEWVDTGDEQFIVGNKGDEDFIQVDFDGNELTLRRTSNGRREGARDPYAQ